jgi:hypothetical protein
MTAPPNSFPTDHGRFYQHPRMQLADWQKRSAHTIEEGPYTPNPSVTNIIDMKAKEFLPPLYARKVAEYVVNNLDAVKYSIDRFGPDVAKGSLKAVAEQREVNGPSDIGDEVHAAIDGFCRGEDYPESFSTNTAKAMYDQWVHFAFEYFNMDRAFILRSEFTVWSYEYGYAGTGDLLFEKDGETWLVDTKTGTRVYPEVALQTAALANADVILDADGNEHPMPLVHKLGVLHVRPRSVKLYELGNADEAFKTFLACKQLFDWKRFGSQGVLGDPAFKTEWRKDAA